MTWNPSLRRLGNNKRPLKAKLIFNPAAGNPEESAVRLVELVDQLQACNIRSDVFLVHPEDQLPDVARKAVREGNRMVIVSGGDGTIESVASALVGTQAILGVIPAGTRNNLALSLGIPTDSVAQAVAILRYGRCIKIDVGRVTNRENNRWFLEAVAVGLASELYPSADDIQHGDLGKIAEFISTFVTHTPSEIRLRLDDSRVEIATSSHMLLVANMPYIGGNFQIADDILFDDRRLDVFVYSHLSKLDLIGHAAQLTSGVPDPRVQRYRVKKVSITANPEMPVVADGVLMKNSPLTVTVRPRGLMVMAGPKATASSIPNLPPMPLNQP
jgi:diacylglycerol kinase (ATP)